MNKYTWSGYVEEKIIDLTVVACRGAMNEQPNNLIIDRIAGHVNGINADERFMVILKIKGEWIASLPSTPMNINKDLTTLPGC